MRAAQGQHRCTCAVDPSLVNVECKVQNVELWTEKKTSLNAPLILHLPFLCRVRNGFTILYKISPLGGLAPFSVEMTEMSFIFRDPSVRAALPRLLRMTEGEMLRRFAPQDDKGARGLSPHSRRVTKRDAALPARPRNDRKNARLSRANGKGRKERAAKPRARCVYVPSSTNFFTARKTCEKTYSSTNFFTAR